MSGKIPQPILTAATTLLEPHCPGLTATQLVEALRKADRCRTATPAQRLTVDDVQEILQLSKESIYRLLRSGVLRGVRHGRFGHWRIDPASVEQYCQAPAE